MPPPLHAFLLTLLAAAVASRLALSETPPRRLTDGANDSHYHGSNRGSANSAPIAVRRSLQQVEDSSTEACSVASYDELSVALQTPQCELVMLEADIDFATEPALSIAHSVTIVGSDGIDSSAFKLFSSSTQDCGWSDDLVAFDTGETPRFSSFFHVIMSGVHVKLVRVELTGACTASPEGGAAFLVELPPEELMDEAQIFFEFEDAHVHHNQAMGHGGVIAANCPVNVVTLGASDFSYNVALEGGVVSTSKSIAMFSYDTSQFFGNVALMNGGVMFADDLDALLMTFDDSVFAYNAAGIFGGVLLSFARNFNMTASGRSLFQGNSAQVTGGVAACELSGTISITDQASFVGNSALFGGISSPGIITHAFVSGDALLVGNIATEDGSLFSSGSDVYLEASGNVYIGQNFAVQSGSVAFSHRLISVKARDNAVFEQNSALNGGAFHCKGQINLEATDNVKFVGNTAMEQGGVLQCHEDLWLDISGHVNFSNNTAINSGGVSWSERDSFIVVSGEVTFTDNHAPVGGVSAAERDLSVDLAGKAQIAANTAVRGGLGYAGRDTFFTMTGTVDASGNSAVEGGLLWASKYLFVVLKETTVPQNMATEGLLAYVDDGGSTIMLQGVSGEWSYGSLVANSPVFLQQEGEQPTPSEEAPLFQHTVGVFSSKLKHVGIETDAVPAFDLTGEVVVFMHDVIMMGPLLAAEEVYSCLATGDSILPSDLNEICETSSSSNSFCEEGSTGLALYVIAEDIAELLFTEGLPLANSQEISTTCLKDRAIADEEEAGTSELLARCPSGQAVLVCLQEMPTADSRLPTWAIALITVVVIGVIVMLIIEELLRARYKSVLSDNYALLSKILPPQVAWRLLAQDKIIEKKRNATPVFGDIIGYTAMANQADPAEVVAMLDDTFREFDDICVEFGLLKVKTIGDCYMAASGCLEEEEHELSLLRSTLFAWRCLKVLEKTNMPRLEGMETRMDMRFGLSQGDVIAGVIGKERLAYDLWGHSVNEAAEMEASCACPNCLHMPSRLAVSLEEHFPGAFTFESAPEDTETHPDQTIETVLLLDVAPERLPALEQLVKDNKPKQRKYSFMRLLLVYGLTMLPVLPLLVMSSHGGQTEITSPTLRATWTQSTHTEPGEDSPSHSKFHDRDLGFAGEAYFSDVSWLDPNHGLTVHVKPPRDVQRSGLRVQHRSRLLQTTEATNVCVDIGTYEELKEMVESAECQVVELSADIDLLQHDAIQVMGDLTIRGISSGPQMVKLFSSTTAGCGWNPAVLQFENAASARSSPFFVIGVEQEGVSIVFEDLEVFGGCTLTSPLGGSVLLSNFDAENGTLSIHLHNTLLHGNAGAGIGGAIASRCNMQVTCTGNTQVYLNQAYGGGAFGSLGAIDLVAKDASTFHHNFVTMSGGVLFTEKPITFLATDESSFVNNSAVFYGGVAYTNSSDLHLSAVGSSLFAGNSAGVVAGVVGAEDNCFIVASGSSVFQDNWCVWGGVAIAGIELNIVAEGNAKFLRNGADRGGGVGLVGARMVVFATDDALFQENYSNKNGGVFSSFVDTNITAEGNALFVNNIAVTGGVSLTFGDMEFTARGNSAFVNNCASEHGGVLYASFSAIIASYGDATFVGNEAVGNGGAFYTEGHLQFNGGGSSIFQLNVAHRGGIVHARGKLSLNFTESISVTNNQAVLGGVGHSDDTINFIATDSSQFIENFAESAGGMLWSMSDVVMDVQGGSFLNNDADDGGCIAFIDDGSFDLLSRNISLSSIDSQCNKEFVKVGSDFMKSMSKSSDSKLTKCSTLILIDTNIELKPDSVALDLDGSVSLVLQNVQISPDPAALLMVENVVSCIIDGSTPSVPGCMPVQEFCGGGEEELYRTSLYTSSSSGNELIIEFQEYDSEALTVVYSSTCFPMQGQTTSCLVDVLDDGEEVGEDICPDGSFILDCEKLATESTNNLEWWVYLVIVVGLICIALLSLAIFYFSQRVRRIRQKNISLVKRAIPSHVMDRLNRGEAVSSTIDSVVVAFGDIVGFTAWSAGQQSPEAAIRKLDEVFTLLDAKCKKFNMYKVKTIGDCYMSSAGTIVEQPPHVNLLRATVYAWKCIEVINEFAQSQSDQEDSFRLGIRFGVAEGPTCAGVIGNERLVFDLWSDSGTCLSLHLAVCLGPSV